MNEDAKRALARERKMKRTTATMWVVIVIAVLLGVFLYIKSLPPPVGLYDALAQCIAKTPTKFYGAAWCPHCHDQKNEFGSAAQYLPYVECSPNPGEQTQVCIDKGITEYPTWYFPDGSSSTGVMSIDAIAQKTGCPLPTSTAQ